VNKLWLIIGGMVAPTVVLAAGDGVDVIPDEWHIWVWTLLTFGVMFVLLAKLAFRPIAEALDRRSQPSNNRSRTLKRREPKPNGRSTSTSSNWRRARSEVKQIIDDGRTLGENVRKRWSTKPAPRPRPCSSAPKRKSSAKRTRASRNFATPWPACRSRSPAR